ncbi:tetratricopeptide repeat protein [Myxococcus eversor]|uniref:tetratricopeptide repeat protein n=1 Tax=Myxococcus eversor TaxID=2709661 RepID=UPI0013D17FF3|nr:bacterial transcriptional activator domain-containing protein [Myxococcus eversor]
MSERAQAQLRALKEAAQLLFSQGRYAECAEVHSRILRMVPKDPNARVRHAEICRRAGDRQAAIASYRTAAELLLAQGCEARARASLSAALELDPRDPVLISDFTRMGQAARPPSTALEDERLYSHVTVSEAPVVVAPRTEARVKTPPPPPPPFVLRAAEETRAPGPLPSAPAIAPVKVKPPGPVTRAPVPDSPSMPSSFPPRGAVAPRQVEAPREVALPVVKGTLVLEQTPAAPRPSVSVAPSQAPRTTATLSPAQALHATASTTAPAPRELPKVEVSASLWTTGAAVTVTPVTNYRPELRWLNPNTVALRASPQSHWVIIRADGPLSLSRMESLPVPARDVPSPAPVAAIEDSPPLIAH